MACRCFWKRFRKHVLATLFFLGVVIGNQGCRIPDLCRPDRAKPMPETFNGEFNLENSACVELHEFFNDPMLTSLVDQALVDNQELKILAQDIRIANNEVLARRGAYFPFISFESSGPPFARSTAHGPSTWPTSAPVWD